MEIESIVKSLEAKQDLELNKFELAIKRALERLNNLVLVNSLNDIKDPLTYDYIFNKYMNQTGVYSAINDFIDNGFDVIYKDLFSAFAIAGIAIEFTAEDTIKINAIKQMTLQSFNDLTVPTINKMKDAMFKYSLSNATTETITDTISTLLADTDLVKYSKTYATTLISNYTQSIIDLKSSETDEGVWLYAGVNDSKTRPYCKCILNQNKYYDDSNKSILQNDKRRAFNCRHIFLKVTEDYAIANGFSKGSASC